MTSWNLAPRRETDSFPLSTITADDSGVVGWAVASRPGANWVRDGSAAVLSPAMLPNNTAEASSAILLISTLFLLLPCHPMIQNLLALPLRQRDRLLHSRLGL